MRTVEQIASDLRKAREEAKVANERVSGYENEMRAIYNAAKDVLGIKDFLPR